MVERSGIVSASPQGGESGIAAVFVGLWLVVLIGFGAFALDTSRIFNEYSELQNGADAAALAIAMDCAIGSCDGYFDALGLADAYADANMIDDTAYVEEVIVDLVDNAVEVAVATESAEGDNTFDMVLANVIGYNGLTVRAETEVVWGSAGGAKVLPLIYSLCEWDAFGSPGFVDEDPNGFLHHESSMAGGFAPYADRYVTIFFHGTSTCQAGPSGQDLPGGFGWLESSEGLCEADVTVGYWVNLDPGASPTSECSPSYIKSLVVTVIGLPYFD
ncbi:MAG: hypothetical protein HKN91_15790, partial [Acidimicrobiia bacterium]|nr:hypothetical protein [Acidimicrobiia bacterium]